MGNVRIFSAINTKIRVLRGNLLDRKDYISLMEKENTEEQINYLKENTIYKEELHSIGDLNDIQKVEIELKHHLISE
ncbi:MAG TPA: hypothetical protein DCG60_05305, partial [Tissierella sp.]